LSQQNKVFRIRYRDGRKTGSKLVITGGTSRLRPRKSSKFIRIEKVSKEQIQKTGKYNELPERLMREFSEARKNGSTPRTLVPVS